MAVPDGTTMTSDLGSIPNSKCARRDDAAILCGQFDSGAGMRDWCQRNRAGNRGTGDFPQHENLRLRFLDNGTARKVVASTI